MQFFYKREAQEVKKDSNGQPIPLKDAQGNAIPKKFETETVIKTDSFNINKIIRTHMINEEHIIVLLDDGHESLETVPTMERNKIVHKNQRTWVQSEISVKGEDAKRLYEVLPRI